MKKLWHNILYYTLRGTWLALSLLPLWLHYAFAAVMSVILAHVFRYRRKVIDKNLRAAYPYKSAAELAHIRRRFYRVFCDYLVEMVKFATMRRANVSRRVVFENAEMVEQFLSKGQSVAMYLGHYGNWEWVTWVRQRVSGDYWGGQIYHPLENAVVDRLMVTVRERMGSACIPMSETLRWVINAKRDGKPSFIGYISDQVPTWHNIHHWLRFMNQTTPVFTGTERIARKFGQAVVYLDVRCVKRGYYVCTFRLITAEPQKMHEHEITDAYFAMLEKTINRAPEYWLWSHNRWKRTREEFNRRYKVVDGRVVEREAD